jgi:hypothetical protein
MRNITLLCPRLAGIDMFGAAVTRRGVLFFAQWKSTLPVLQLEKGFRLGRLWRCGNFAVAISTEIATFSK